MSVDLNEIKDLIRETMAHQGAAILKAAKENAEEVVTFKMKESQREMQEKVEQEIHRKTNDVEHKFANNINGINFNFCKQMEDILHKTESYVELKDDQGITKALEKGKKLIQNHKQTLLIADSEGWDVAKGFLASPLVENEEQEKRLRRARKEAEQAKKLRKVPSNDNAIFEKKSSMKRFRRDENQRETQKTCWTCGSFGHFARACYKNRFKGQ